MIALDLSKLCHLAVNKRMIVTVLLLRFQKATDKWNNDDQ